MNDHQWRVLPESERGVVEIRRRAVDHALTFSEFVGLGVVRCGARTYRTTESESYGERSLLPVQCWDTPLDWESFERFTAIACHRLCGKARPDALRIASPQVVENERLGRRNITRQQRSTMLAVLPPDRLRRRHLVRPCACSSGWG